MMKLLFFFSLVVASRAAVQFSRSDMGSNGFKESVIEFKDRIYVPYGPDRTTNPPQDPANQPWTGYGYGLGATEHWAYDSKEKYIYSQSEFGGYITIIDYAELPGTVTDVSLDVGGDNVEVRDIVVCSEQGLLFVTVTDRNTVLMYETVKRDDPQVPLLIESIAAGNSPDAMKLSNDCAILAVANQNEGRSILSQGAVTLVTNFRSSQGSTVTSVLLTGFTDEDLLERNVNMPLTRQAMQYWTQELELGWDGPDGLIEQYNPAIALDPEFLAFSADGSTLYLNLQDNSALVRIDTATGQARAVDGYGLKKIAVDIVKDGECQLVSDDCLFLGRTPDGIASVEYEGTDYVFTADEGSGFDLDDYEEEYDSNDVFGPGGAIQLSGFVVSETVASCAAHFADGCNETWCSNFEMSVGTLAVDYSDPTTPIMNNIVGFGGRGVSLFRIPDSFDDPITFVWDSGSTFEEETCANFPWAHNSVMDEDFAPVGGPRWILNVEDREGIEELNDINRDGCTLSDGSTGACPLQDTVDEKAESDGLAPETVVVGIACDHLVMLACGENNAMCFLYDITEIESPELIKTFNLSPDSRDQNPEQTYRKTLGDLDSETTLFLSPDESPTGNSGFLFGGAISGTLSFWEFQCQSPEVSSRSDSTATTDGGSDGLEGGAIAGIVVGAVAALVIVGFIAMKAMGGGNQKETEHTHQDDGGVM